VIASRFVSREVRKLVKEDVMSLSLLATNVIERLRTRARALRPEAPPETTTPETAHQQRDRLRQETLARGGVLTDIETIKGDCPAQTAQQIRDLTQWLEQRG
jgi:hypothetical protein